MEKIIFIKISTNDGVYLDSMQTLLTPELDKLIKDGWGIMNTENITPPQASSKSIIQVYLRKED